MIAFRNRAWLSVQRRVPEVGGAQDGGREEEAAAVARPGHVPHCAPEFVSDQTRVRAVGIHHPESVLPIRVGSEGKALVRYVAPVR